MLREAHDWTADTFRGDESLWQHCAGCVHFTQELAFAAIQEYDLVPLLFARLDKPGVRDRCLAQWHEVGPRHHDRLTWSVLHPSQPLAAAVNAMNPDGTGMSDDLAHEVCADCGCGWGGRWAYFLRGV